MVTSEAQANGRGRGLRIGAVLALLTGIAVLAFASFTMAQRLADRDIELVYFHDPIMNHEFTFQGEPALLERTESAEGPLLRLTYRGATADFPIATEDLRLPGLLGYEDWFRIQPMYTGIRTAEEILAQYEAGTATPRMIVIGRSTPEGYDPETWGMVRRRDWVYRIAELHPAPAAQPITFVEKTFRELDALHSPGPHTPEELIPTPEERDRDLWMHYAMRSVTPTQFLRAKDRSMDSALAAMGWTWPTAGVSVLVFAVSGVVLATTTRGVTA